MTTASDNDRRLILFMTERQLANYTVIDDFCLPQERNFLVAAIIIEFVVSIVYYSFRAIYVDLMSAQVVFLCLFVRSQLTNTVTLGLVFLPKLLHPQKKVSQSIK